jgi:hypothetical protein
MNQNGTPMEEQTLTAVLQEMADELKQAKIFMESQEKALTERDKLLAEKEKQLQSLINLFEERYKTIQIVASNPDTREVEQMLAAGFDRLNAAFEKGPKPVTRNWRFILFPETNTDYYYKMVFGRLIPWSFAMIAALFLFSLAKNALTSYRLHEYNEQCNNCIKAWNEVYKRGGKLRKKEMDAAWAKAEKEN